LSFLLDSNVCIQLLRTSRASQAIQPRIRQRLDAAEAAGRDAIVCSVVRLELLAGALRSEHSESNLDRVSAFLSAFPTLPFDDSAADHGSRIRAHLQAAGTLISPLDLLIAAIALSRNLTLVTHNTAEFARIPRLALQDWEAAA
jgi:tRNA(fMet)-specific endonuclease VapC